ncbi:hypothetical protein MKEN_00170900 [Mycena kentingensis (nom. inval.)]|nr:hypothetical protein MKEN_00170900 [Mycena kentingensis (nom. inval.)]
MRPSLRRLADSLSTQPLNPRNAEAALLPPKPLFRRILRAHRSLAPDLRYMGDGYVKSEFRRHQTTTNPAHVIGFLGQWKLYLDTLPRGPDSKSWTGRKLDETALEKMSKEQLGQLHELKIAAKEVWRKSPANS